MVQVNRQQPPKPGAKPTPKPPGGGGILDRIQKLDQPKPGSVKLSLYGRGKTGKTRLASTFPKPMLLIGTEDGTDSIVGTPGIDFAPVQSSEEVAQLIEVATQRGYKTVCLDHASGLNDLILMEILGLSETPVQKSWGMATRDQYGQQGMKLKRLLRGIIDLPTHVVIIAHERNFKDDDTPSDLLTPSVGSALSASSTNWLNGAVKHIAQTFIREGYTLKTTTLAGKNTQVREKTGQMEYCLRIGPHPVYMTGFRLPPGFELPEVIVDPTFDKIMKVIQGTKL